MTILAVSNNAVMLDKLCNGLSNIHPNANVIRENDSLMAGKYSFNNKVIKYNSLKFLKNSNIQK